MAGAAYLQQSSLPADVAELLRVNLKSRTATERERAVRQLAKPEHRGHREVLAALRAVSQDMDKFVRKEVAAALGVLSLQGDSSAIALLHSMCDDREWTVRYSALKSMILVECGPKRSGSDNARNEHWKPASKRILDVVTKGIFDKQPEMRCAAAEAAAMAIEDNDPEDLIFDLILTAGSNTMAIDKSNVKKDGEEGGSISRKPSVASVVQDLGFGRAPSFARRTSSNGSQRSSKWASAFERLKSDPKIDRTQAFFSRLGQAVHMEGSGIFMAPAHPPASLDAGITPQHGGGAEDVQGRIAIFALHPRRMHMAMMYDCAYRSDQQGAIGAVFCVKTPEITAAERYDAFEMQKSFDQEGDTPAPKRLNIPVICVSDLMKNAIDDNAVLTVMPNASIVRGLLADDQPAARAAAVRAMGAVAKRNDPRLVDVLVSMISDPVEEVRRVCVEVFTNPAKIWPGNPEAIEALASVTTHEDWHVREASMTALCKVANCDRETCDPDGEINNPIAIEAVIARLKDTEGLVKKLAIDGLVILALADGVIDAEDLPIIDTFVESQSDADPLVAAACTKALAFLSGEDKEITSVFQWMCDGRPQIRKSSVYALGKAKQNNPVIISMLRRRTLDDFGEVRACAVSSLAKVSRQGDAEVMAMIDPLLDDRDAAVRCAAVDALAEVMLPYDQGAQGSLPRLLRLVEMVENPDVGVRNCASDALDKRARGSPEVANSLKQVLESHEDFSVRKTALQTIHRILDLGEERMLEAIRISLRDARGEVRKLGFQLLKHHYEAGRDGGVDVDSLKESVLDCVKDGDPMVVFVTIESIPALFSQGNRMAIMALVRCLRHEAPSVREAATRVLGEFAIRGDLRAIGYIVPLIDHHMAYVRYAAIIALMNLGVPGDAKVLEPIKTKMNDPEIFVRREAVTALRYLSVRGDERCVSALLACMEDPDERIRVAAMTGLSVVANHAEPRAVAAFMKKIHIDTRPMRKLSVECLACLIKEDDYENLELLMVSLEDTEHIVRQAGVEAVTKIVRRGDDFVIKRLMETRCQHEDRKIRAVAMQVLQGIALPGDERIVDGMILALQHLHAQVRKMAAEVICNVAKAGDQKVIDALASLLADGDSDVRRAAIDGIKNLSPANSEFAIAKTVHQLASAEWFVRDAAQEVLLAIADKGNDTAMTSLKQLLTRTEWYAREIAIVCIKKLSVACSCDIFDELGASCRCSVVQTLIELTQDPYWKVRTAAMTTLQVVASRRDKRVALACRARLKDGDFNVRNTAEEMLRFFE